MKSLCETAEYAHFLTFCNTKGSTKSYYLGNPVSVPFAVPAALLAKALLTHQLIHTGSSSFIWLLRSTTVPVCGLLQPQATPIYSCCLYPQCGQLGTASRGSSVLFFTDNLRRIPCFCFVANSCLLVFSPLQWTSTAPKKPAQAKHQ